MRFLHAGQERERFCCKVRFLGKIQNLGLKNSMAYRLPNSRKNNFATEPLKPPEGAAVEPGAVCPICQHGRMQLITTVYRQPAAWDLSVPVPGLDTS